ncbi:MAG: 3-oxoacyl-ACP synthase [Spirochaetaceae bacterium]|nr:3-oxoacyl-ACP synthase [Spirochaetaceae bacterium]
MRTRVYLSKPGIISCTGNNIETLYTSLAAAKRDGIVPFTISGLHNFLVGRVFTEFLPPAAGCHDTRILRITAAAAAQIEESIRTVVQRFGGDRVALCVGSCDNGSEFSLPAHHTFFTKGSFPDDYDIDLQGASGIAEYLAAVFNIKGPLIATSAACASSADALIKAASFIRAGICDAAVAGGVDIAKETVLLGFDSLGAVSKGLSNPFSKNRDGINLGEGGAFFVLSKEPFPMLDKQVILAGEGLNADAYHMTAPEPEGIGARRAMEEALGEAGIGPKDIDYINLHGTGTVQNDRAEAKAVASLFKDTAPLVSSTKPLTGHTLGAAGALESAVCWYLLSGKEGPSPAAPLHCWDGVRDEELPHLRFAEKGELLPHIRYCMSNSFAFGGCNTSLVLGSPDAG